MSKKEIICEATDDDGSHSIITVKVDKQYRGVFKGLLEDNKNSFEIHFQVIKNAGVATPATVYLQQRLMIKGKFIYYERSFSVKPNEIVVAGGDTQYVFMSVVDRKTYISYLSSVNPNIKIQFDFYSKHLGPLGWSYLVKGEQGNTVCTFPSQALSST